MKKAGGFSAGARGAGTPGPSDPLFPPPRQQASPQRPQELAIPPRFHGQKTLSPPHADALFFEQYLKRGPIIRSLLLRSGFAGLSHVVDFGCHVGGWSWQLARLCRRVTALDVDDRLLGLGRAFCRENGLFNVSFLKSAPEILSSLPPTDGIVCVTTLQTLPSDDVLRFFDFARAKLKTKGLLLFNTASVRMAAEWSLKLERLKIDGWKGVAGYALRGLRSLFVSTLRPGRRYYFLPPRAVAW